MPLTAASLAGRYTHSFRNGNVAGEAYTSTDTVVIVPIDAGHAVFDIHLNFFNGHECSIGGLATLDHGTLVYRDPEATGYEGQSCELRIRRRGNRLAWDDGGTCVSYCGARGSLRDGGLAWSSRRPISRAERRRILRDYERNLHHP